MLLHFNLDCPQRTDALSVASCASLAEFTALQRADPAKYCALCTRTDSDRYAELRALVEAWQKWQRDPHYNQVDACERLIDWSHR